MHINSSSKSKLVEFTDKFTDCLPLVSTAKNIGILLYQSTSKADKAAIKILSKNNDFSIKENVKLHALQKSKLTAGIASIPILGNIAMLIHYVIKAVNPKEKQQTSVKENIIPNVDDLLNRTISAKSLASQSSQIQSWSRTVPDELKKSSSSPDLPTESAHHLDDTTKLDISNFLIHSNSKLDVEKFLDSLVTTSSQSLITEILPTIISKSLEIIDNDLENSGRIAILTTIVNHNAAEPSMKDASLTKDIIEATFFHRNNAAVGLHSNDAKNIVKLILDKIELNDELRVYAFGEALDCFRGDAYSDSEFEILDKITANLKGEVVVKAFTESTSRELRFNHFNKIFEYLNNKYPEDIKHNADRLFDQAFNTKFPDLTILKLLSRNLSKSTKEDHLIKISYYLNKQFQTIENPSENTITVNDKLFNIGGSINTVYRNKLSQLVSDLLDRSSLPFSESELNEILSEIYERSGPDKDRFFTILDKTLQKNEP